MASSATASPAYVEIDAKCLGAGNAQPFGKIKIEPKTKKGRKTCENTWLYIFTTQHEGQTYFKIGNTYLNESYGSKKRYCPFLKYTGLVMVLHYGRALELLLSYYLGPSYDESEWYTGAECEKRIAAFIAALGASEHFQTERPQRMGNVSTFKHCFTARHVGRRATLETYLTLFRLRVGTRLVELHEATIDTTVRRLTQPDEK